jgi:hypothetical protein
MIYKNKRRKGIYEKNKWLAAREERLMMSKDSWHQY